MVGKHSLHLVYWRRHANIVTPIGILLEIREPILLARIVCIREVGEEKVGPYPIVLVACERPVELIPEDDILDEAAIRV